MKRTITSMLGALAVAVGFSMLAVPAAAQVFPPQVYGGITCRDYRDFNPNASTIYPNEGHYFVCSTATFAPSVNKANVVFGRVSTLRPFAITTLDNRNVTFYLFKNRADANTFMGAKHPGGVFTSTTAQCGYTAVQGSAIEASLYNTCSYTSTQTSNNDLNKVTVHESGHAFDYALGLSHSVNPSRSLAFAGLASGDRTVLTPQGSQNPTLNWTTMTATQRRGYICQMFSTLVPSALEAALGANPTGFAGSVCTNGTASGLKPAYKDALGNPIFTPTQIADKKMPYFVNPAQPDAILWQELWAEEFSFLNGGQGIGAAILKFTDNALTAGVAPNASMHCTRYALTIWLLDAGVPPTPAQLTEQGCFGYQQTDFYHQ